MIFVSLIFANFATVALYALAGFFMFVAGQLQIEGDKERAAASLVLALFVFAVAVLTQIGSAFLGLGA